MGLHPQKLIRTGVIMLVWCLLLVGAVSAVQGEEASSGGLAPPPVQPWGVNAYNLGGFGPGSSGSFDGAEGGDFGGGLGGPFFGPSTMPGFSPGYGMRPYDIRNNFMYNDMTMGRGLNPFSSDSILGEHKEDDVDISNGDFGMGGYGGYGGYGRGYGGMGYYGGFGKGYGGFGHGYGGFGHSHGGYGIRPPANQPWQQQPSAFQQPGAYQQPAAQTTP